MTDHSLNFVEVKDKDPEYKAWEYELEDWIIRILKHKDHDFFSVYARKFVYEEWRNRWYIDVMSNKATNLKQAKSIWEKLLDIVLWYKSPEPWKEY